jgi:putative intracellular protease/amidase
MSRPLSRHLRFAPPRDVEFGALHETLLITGVATILVIRTQLWLTNYPQLGGRGLHIAHLLWGGLFMLIAIVILLAFVSPAERQIAAVAGGIGLGLFMDELGKFVTADNNYFFKPTAAIVYCFFVVFFLVIRQLDRRRRLSPRESLVNAIELVKEAALHTMDEPRRRKALALLARADQSEPLVPELRHMLEDVRTRPARPRSAAARSLRRLRQWFFAVVDRPWFSSAVGAFFAVWAVASLVQIVGLVVFETAGLSSPEVFRLGENITNDPLGDGERTFLEVANLTASVVAAAFVLVGLDRLAKGRRAGAFAMFERALLVSIFFTQVFAFVQSQFAAVFGLAVDLLLFIAVRAVLGRELEREALGTVEAGPTEPATARA